MKDNLKPLASQSNPDQFQDIFEHPDFTPSDLEDVIAEVATLGHDECMEVILSRYEKELEPITVGGQAMANAGYYGHLATFNQFIPLYLSLNDKKGSQNNPWQPALNAVADQTCEDKHWDIYTMSKALLLMGERQIPTEQQQLTLSSLHIKLLHMYSHGDDGFDKAMSESLVNEAVSASTHQTFDVRDLFNASM